MKYKIKSNIVIDEIDDVLVLTKKNQNQEIDYNHAIVLEDVGKFIFNLLAQGMDDEYIINQVITEYNVQKDKAQKDLKNFINQLVEAQIIYD